MTTKLMAEEMISKFDNVKRISEKAERLEKIADDLVTDHTLVIDIRRRGSNDIETVDNLLVCSVDRRDLNIKVGQMLREYAYNMRMRAKADYEKIIDELKGMDKDD